MSSTRSVAVGEADGGGDGCPEVGTGIGRAVWRRGRRRGRSSRGGAPARANRKPCVWPSTGLTLGWAGRLRQGDRADGRAGGPAHLQRQADECELVHVRGRQLLQAQVLDDRDAAADQQEGGARQGFADPSTFLAPSPPPPLFPPPPPTPPST